MPQARVSACVAVYNGVAHLRQCLEAIRRQTRPADEIVVLDDGSQDRSAAIAEELGARVIRQKNAGIGAGRKRLIEEAAGDFVAFCDHDDTWTDTHLETLAGHIGEGVLIYGLVTHEGVAQIPHAKPEQPNLRHLIPYSSDIWTSATLIDRKAALEAGNFDPSYRSGEDLLMWFQLGRVGRIVQIPEVITHMSRLEGSTSSSNRKVHEGALRLYRHIIDHLREWYPEATAADVGALERRYGYTQSIVACHREQQGERSLALHWEAVRRCPSKGVLYRFVRSLMGLPAKPPI
jgi:glycosyltransferase involved in cell wall biosynthesis